jgi:phage tail-like protein
MARAVADDFIHSMRFQVSVAGDGTQLGAAEAGFTTVTTPEATVEAAEYKEGTFVYTRKYPGNPTVTEISMSRGVTRSDSSFWKWLRTVIEGTGEYRADLDIKHFHREQALLRPVDEGGDGSNFTGINTDSPARTYHIREAFPTRHKVAGDLDATASEISLMEIEVAYEHFEVEEHA